MNILVLCTGNSARSILLESLLTHLSDGRVTSFSAGSQPAGQVNPHAMALLKKKGHETGGFRSKSWDEFGAADAPEMDIVITVCGSAAAETCPMWPGTPLRAHWGWKIRQQRHRKTLRQRSLWPIISWPVVRLHFWQNR